MPPAQRIVARRGPARAASLRICVCGTAIAIVGASITSAGAKDWPTRPIRLVVGASAGGGTDMPARLIAQPLAEILGQTVVVENRAGAAGPTAAEAVAKSPKDGYTAYRSARFLSDLNELRPHSSGPRKPLGTHLGTHLAGF